MSLVQEQTLAEAIRTRQGRHPRLEAMEAADLAGDAR